MTSSPIIDNLNSGELSPLLAGRVGFDKYPNGASQLLNFIPTVQGPHRRRAGFRFVHEVKNSGAKVLLVPFQFSVDQAYIVEFGNLYARFYTWDSVTKVRGILEVSPGVPVEIVTPYTSSDLYNTDGSPRLSFAQSGDFLYLAHSAYQQRVLKRVTATSFSIDLYVSTGGPFLPLNNDPTITVYSVNATGATVLNSSAAIFNPNDVGSLFYLASKDVTTIKAWEVGKAVALGDEAISDSKTYVALNAGTTGTVQPVHTSGAYFDGTGGVQWQFRDAGYGTVRITSYTDPKKVDGTVIDRIPSPAVGAGNASNQWAFGAWSTRRGYPSCVALFRGRVWWGGGQTLWSSVSADYNNFSAKNFGQVTADMAITAQMDSGSIDNIQWLAPDRDLLVGTAGGEFAVGELSNGSALSPNNLRSRLMSAYGSRAIKPIKNGDSLLFIQRAGLKARETFYDFGADGYKSTDTTVLAEHVSRTGLVQMVFAQEPDQIIWMLRADGRLIGFTWNNEQQVRGWHPHSIGGNGFVESIAVIPAAEGDRNELWAVVKRTINGVTKRYVEYMEKQYQSGAAPTTQFYVDAGLTYSGAATTTISGLGHLEGMTVSILANGAPHPDRVVTSGAITLQLSATNVQVGLGYSSIYRSMRLESDARNGTSQGKTKRIHKVVFRLMDCGGGKYGALNGGQMDDLLLRTTDDAMDLPAPLYTGDKVVAWPDGYNTDAYVGFQVDQPVAATLVAIMPQISTNDAR